MIESKDLHAVDLNIPQKRGRFVGLRLRQDEARQLQKLAEAEGVGVSTFARLVVEKYLAIRALRPSKRPR
jgi:hypothetical protein